MSIFFRVMETSGALSSPLALNEAIKSKKNHTAPSSLYTLLACFQMGILRRGYNIVSSPGPHLPIPHRWCYRCYPLSSCMMETLGTSTRRQIHQQVPHLLLSQGQSGCGKELASVLFFPGVLSDKIDDPMWSIQICRMQELPNIYRRVYDQPFHIPALEKEETLK